MTQESFPRPQEGSMKETFQRGSLTIEKTLGELVEDELESRSLEIIVIKGDKRIRLNDLIPSPYQLTEWEGSSAIADMAKKVIFIPNKLWYIKVPPGSRAGGSIESWRITENSLLERRDKGDGTVLERHRFLSLKGSMYEVLHEIGHANYSLSNEDNRRRTDLQSGLQLGSTDIENASDEEIRDYIDLILNPERQASAYALMTLRNFKRQGVDLEEDMSNSEIIAYVNPHDIDLPEFLRRGGKGFLRGSA